MPKASVMRIALFDMWPFVRLSIWFPSTVTAGSETVMAAPSTKLTGRSIHLNQPGRDDSKNKRPMYWPTKAKP